MIRIIFIIPFLFLALLGRTQESGLVQVQGLQLSKPQLHYSSLFFKDSLEVTANFRHPGAKIYYVTNQLRNQEEGLHYKKPFVFKKTTLLVARTEHPDFLPSEPVMNNFIRAQNFPIHTKIAIRPTANPPYNKSSTNALIDFQGGSIDFRNGDRWLGFQDDSVSIKLEFPTPIVINDLYVSFLRDQSSWIFLPKHMELWSEGKKVSSKLITGEEVALPKSVCPYFLPVDDIKTNSIEIKLFGIKTLPDWHSAAGSQPWIFIDEILLTKK